MAKKLASYLNDAALRRLGIALDRERQQALEQVWIEAAGQPLAAHVRPLRYTDGCLILRAESSVWASKLRHQPQRLISALRRHAIFQELIGLQVRVVPPEQAATVRGPERTTRKLSPKIQALLDSVAEHTPDEALRDALRRLGRREKS